MHTRKEYVMRRNKTLGAIVVLPGCLSLSLAFGIQAAENNLGKGKITKQIVKPNQRSCQGYSRTTTFTGSDII